MVKTLATNAFCIGWAWQQAGFISGVMAGHGIAAGVLALVMAALSNQLIFGWWRGHG